MSLIKRLPIGFLQRISMYLSFSTQIAPVTKLPSEFLLKVSTYLSSRDCWNATQVCKTWYHTFQIVLYKKIYIHSDLQLTQLIPSLLNNGYLVKELHLATITSHNFSSYSIDKIALPHTRLKQDALLALNKLCPALEVLIYDPSMWIYIGLEKIATQWKQMRYRGIVRYTDFNSSFLPVYGPNLTQLHMKHYRWHLEGIVERLSILVVLKDLTLEMCFSDYEDGGEPILSLAKCLEKLHYNLPQLQVFQLMRNNAPHSGFQEIIDFSRPAVSILSLTLHGYVDSIHWLTFISKNYPNLQELNISDITLGPIGLNWDCQAVFVKLIKSLPLVRLSLGKKYVSQLLSKELLVELNTSSINDVNLDLGSAGSVETGLFLFFLGSHGLRQLRYLSANICEQNFVWPGVIRHLFHCQGLNSLELCFLTPFNSHSLYISFRIDCFLQNLPQLRFLSLSKVNMQVTQHHFKELKLEKFKLEKLVLLKSKVESHHVVFEYLSACCHNLQQVLLRECVYGPESNTETFCMLNEWTMNLKYSRLDKLVLSSKPMYNGKRKDNEYIGVEINDENGKQMIWSHASKFRSAFQYSVKYNCKLNNVALDKLYQFYKSSSENHYDILLPDEAVIGVLVIHCKSVSEVVLDNVKVIKK